MFVFVFISHLYIFSVNDSKTFMERGDVGKKKDTKWRKNNRSSIGKYRTEDRGGGEECGRVAWHPSLKIKPLGYRLLWLMLSWILEAWGRRVPVWEHLSTVYCSPHSREHRPGSGPPDHVKINLPKHSLRPIKLLCRAISPRSGGCQTSPSRSQNVHSWPLQSPLGRKRLD